MTPDLRLLLLAAVESEPESDSESDPEVESDSESLPDVLEESESEPELESDPDVLYVERQQKDPSVIVFLFVWQRLTLQTLLVFVLSLSS